MALNVKNKIWLGTFFLFLLLLLAGGVGIYSLIRIKNDAKGVIKENYKTLAYCHTMQSQLDSISIDYERSIAQFEKALQQQERNITETGEAEATLTIKSYFKKLQQKDTTASNIRAIRQQLQLLLAINMKAIQQKDNRAEATADKALTYISLLSVIVFIIAFTFSLNFPLIVAGPIQNLTEAIGQISNKNYSHRIHITNKDEFGQLADAFNDMAERLELFESSNLSQLLFEKSRAEAVINSLKDASIGIDKSGRVLFANYQALQLLSLKSTDVVGKPVKDLSRGNKLLQQVIEDNTAPPFKIAADGKESFFIKEIIEVEHSEGNSRVIVLKDITPFKELDTAKTNFIATISHELKTPLASSGFSLKLLEDARVGSLTEEQKELVQNMKADNQRMLKILSELLNVAQVETGKIQLHLQAVHPQVIINSAMLAVANAANEKTVNIQIFTENYLPQVKADPERTSWVLNNLLTNAIKYSYSGSVIDIIVKQKEHEVVFSVLDRGPGITGEYQPKIFERYYKVPGALAKGTGLGLAISKECIEAQGGRIWVESEPGSGSNFLFTLPKV